jgi:glycosyltransferase involved in cell wall biosynthesis
MDWQPNVGAVQYFVTEILPIIHASRPETTVAIVGRNPASPIIAAGERDVRIHISGTVPDVRPYLWGGLVSIVPLRIGGGTRLKIYEAMAARIPVVSTTIGAEGLGVQPGHEILIGDSPELFARHCLDLLGDAARRRGISDAAWQLVAANYSWRRAADEFEAILAGTAVGAAA